MLGGGEEAGKGDGRKDGEVGDGMEMEEERVACEGGLGVRRRRGVGVFRERGGWKVWEREMMRRKMGK